MTNKTTMPDPMVEVDKHIVAPELQYTYLAPCGGLEHGTELITTTQAEAYANARVRGALLEAYRSIQELHMSLMNDSTPYVHPAQVASFAANRISALIPKDKE